MKRFKFIVFPLIGFFIFISATTYKNDFFEIAKQIEIFTTLFKELNMNYVDDTNPAELMDSAIKHMLSNLDPYTQFYNEQDVETELIKRTGDYAGVGARIRFLKDKLVVVEPYKNFPADKAGLKAGDEITKINGLLISEFNSDVEALLKGASGSSLTVTYSRQNKVNTTIITRDEVAIKAIPFYSMVNATTGYIALDRFSPKATLETKNALIDLKAQGASSLILDLRGNPGGLLNEAVDIVNLFVPKNQVVVTTKSKIKKYNKTYQTTNDPLDTEIPLIVLINGQSASASEIVSGALQDLDRAVIIGARSFGKGLVQRPKELTYGTQLKLTISRYYIPSGRSIQAMDYTNGKAERNAPTKYQEFKTKNGRPVYSGGGILPDKTIESLESKPIITALEDANLIFDFATQFYYKNPEIDVNTFAFFDDIYKAFKAFLEANSFSFETKTEAILETLADETKKNALYPDIEREYNLLVERIKASKENAIDAYRVQISNLLTDEIVKRYGYRDGLYAYYLKHDEAIRASVSMVSNLKEYNALLK